ncbi:glutamine--fructose-6-phosphate transaminase (isomerizing) [Halomicroarcula sp. S1AR25-4]|uniref:glutamine--fructose-6-phosphate transaminase (isomerizing) n=1 Tax=Haloarcula sp. S1AR25-4 TaxID=2950538 RepID=UPI00287701E9|nr:glutamine--fructose-6-phosphate transaminase (isomerizing) [Halomicroarcula sp. S1AR25-4]MDS0279890.1 glutamine--fructose-6-phosphate transaminase (isomerizing) [Halomicroarcula sp. S1AR25-4]
MCGIIAHAGADDAVGTLIDGLERLEYRGYDSAGIAVQNGSGIAVHKRAGDVSEVREEIQTAASSGDVGIGHTRWSTHGPPTDENAHPHTSDTDNVAVVHNGIIENHAELREFLADEGYEFTSDTDTEVIPHLIEHFRKEESETIVAFRRAVEELEGSYAIAALVRDEGRVYAARAGSPLVLGLDDDQYYLASDIPAFIEHTRDVVYLEDGDVVVLEPNEAQIFDENGLSVERSGECVDWNPEDVGKGAFDHYMLKEIHNQSSSLSKTIRGRVDPDNGRVALEELDAEILDGVENVHLVACGTSYHAALFGARMLTDAGVRARVFRASEYAKMAGPTTEGTLVIPVTQSGETADTLSALRTATERGATTVTVTNVVGSTAAREADESVFIRAGPEIGVAATKTFTSQVVTLILLSQKIAAELPNATTREDLPELLAALEQVPTHIDQVVETSRAADLASRLLEYDAYFFIGRGMSRPVALEGALKFKEITYEHAEGFASGQLKHGPLALVTSQTPVFGLFTGDEAEKTITNAKEAQTRGAEIIGIGPENGPGAAESDAYLRVPDTHPVCQNLLANVQLQLVSYHTAKQLDRSIDKPRNLAKSVTVQ